MTSTNNTKINIEKPEEIEKIDSESFSIFHLKKYFPTYKIVSIQEGEKHFEIHEDDKTNDIKIDKIHDDGLTEGEEGLRCGTAPGVVFKDLTELAAHYKTDWHLWNLKLKASNLPPIDKAEFEKSKKDGASTMEEQESDSDSEVDRKPLKGSNRISFITDTQKIELWKNTILPDPSERHTTYEDLISSLKSIHEKTNYIVFMSSGGRFAGAVFEKDHSTLHKTFVRYTVRKKQGGSQSTKDNKSGSSAPKSAGATLRRYNEKRFREQVLEILSEWEEAINTAHRIFLCAPSANWNYFFVGTKGLKRGDPRIRSVPFTTHRPSLLEAKRIHQILSSVEVSNYVPDENASSTEKCDPKSFTVENVIENIAVIDNSSSFDSNVTEDAIAKAIKNNNLEDLINIFQTDYEIPIPDDVNAIKTPVFIAVEENKPEILKYLLELDTGDINSPVIGWFNRTALHKAADSGNLELVKMLLDANADPSVKDITGKTAYVLGNNNIREYFRKYAADHLDLWEWEKFGVNPLTKEKEEEKKAKLAEKKKRKKVQAKKNKNEKLVQEQVEAEKKKNEENQREKEKLLIKIAEKRATKLANLTEREKRALAAESRISGRSDNCAFCLKSIGVIPFERKEFKYCSLDCARNHLVNSEL